MIRVTAFRAMVTHLRNKAARSIISETVVIHGTAGSATVTHRASWAARSIDAGVVSGITAGPAAAGVAGATVSVLVTGTATARNTPDTLPSGFLADSGTALGVAGARPGDCDTTSIVIAGLGTGTADGVVVAELIVRATGSTNAGITPGAR